MVSTIDGLNCNSFPKNVRPPITYPSPSMWTADALITLSVDDDHQVQEKYLEAIQELKQEARSMLLAADNSIKDELVLIDTLERLGVAYHFEREIEEKLKRVFDSHHQNDIEDLDLFTTALRFRLLRQHQHLVPSSVFEKFKDKDNKFDKSLITDPKGLLSLYEAAHVNIHDEIVLEEALAFTTHHLKNMVDQDLKGPLRDQVKRALYQSLHRGVTRIEHRTFISFYERDESKNERLLRLAKLDFNCVQNLYKKELYELCRWWDKFDLKSKLPYVRDRIVESYLWGMASKYEPQYSHVRIAVAKTMQLCTMLDDTYDNYATIEEADLFTKALERWDINDIEDLPEYMKIVFKFVWSSYDDFGREAAERGKSFVMPYAVESVKQLGRAYNKELKWFMGRQMPSYEEYFANTLYTGCIFVMYTPVITGMESVSEEAIDWLLSPPDILMAATRIARYVEDLRSHDRERKGGEMLTAAECYMKQYDVTKGEALDNFLKLFEEGWKDVNKDWLTEASVPKDMVEQLLNYSRVAEIMYKHQDGFTDPEKYLGPQIVALFRDPIDVSSSM